MRPVPHVGRWVRNHRCAYCGEKAASRDHIIPIARGGQNVIENVVPACIRCNNIKANATAEEFFKYIEWRIRVEPQSVTGYLRKIRNYMAEHWDGNAWLDREKMV